MKNSWESKKILAYGKRFSVFTSIMLVLLFAFSCSNLIMNDGGSLIIAVPGARAASASSFTIELTGTNGTPQSKTVAGGTTVQFDDLAPDTYSIVVEGMDASGAVVFYGTSSATVTAGKTASADVELMKGASDYASLQSAVGAGGTVYIFENIDVIGSLIINKDVTIRALDKDVTLNHTGLSSLFTVQDSATLTIGGGDYMLTVDGNKQTRADALLRIKSGTVDLYGTITNGVNNSSAGGIKVEGSSSTLNMYDGAIVNNCECSNINGIGGAIGLDAGNMNMYGGTITGNTAQNASAVYVNDTSVFTMSGGTISGNSNDIAVNVSSSTFKIGGGALISSDDKVSLKESHVIIMSELSGPTPVATITLESNAKSDSTVETAGEGIVLENEVKKFTLSGCTIDSDGTLKEVQ